jgi:hypothetical protein
MVARLRQTTGQPHWIVVDEAHYFLDQSDYGRLIDASLGAYLLVTYRVSNLHPDLLKVVESIIVTQLTEARESRQLTSLYGQNGAESSWDLLFSKLQVDEAAILPPAGTEAGTPRKFRVAERLTPHVRHRAKYLEVPLSEGRGFTFTCNGTPVGTPALNLKEFVSMLTRAPAASLEEHARRSDFSRWIAEVLGDRPLADRMRVVEQNVARGDASGLAQQLIAAIRERYE